MELNTFKARLKKQIENAYSANVIFQTYDIFAQLNAGIMGGNSEMEEFISEKKQDIATIKSDIENLESINVTDADFPNCQTQEMKQMINLALQDVMTIGF